MRPQFWVPSPPYTELTSYFSLILQMLSQDSVPHIEDDSLDSWKLSQFGLPSRKVRRILLRKIQVWGAQLPIRLSLSCPMVRTKRKAMPRWANTQLIEPPRVSIGESADSSAS